MGLLERFTKRMKEKENRFEAPTMEEIEEIERRRVAKIKQQQDAEDKRRVEEYKASHGILDKSISFDMIPNWDNLTESEKTEGFRKLQGKLKEEQEKRDSFILDSLNFYEWLKNSRVKKLKNEDYSIIENARENSGDKFFFDNFAMVSPDSEPARIEGFVCDHDGVKSQDRMICVPLDADAFCECVKNSSAKVLRQLATNMPYSIKEYVYRFGWGEKEFGKIKGAIIERYTELNAMTVGRSATAGEERQTGGNTEEK